MIDESKPPLEAIVIGTSLTKLFDIVLNIILRIRLHVILDIILHIL